MAMSVSWLSYIMSVQASLLPEWGPTGEVVRNNQIKWGSSSRTLVPLFIGAVIAAALE